MRYYKIIVVVVVFIIHVSNCLTFSKEKMNYYRDRVRSMFYRAYDGYVRHAYPLDELKPITCTGMNTWGSFSLTLIDALDTLMIIGNYTEFERAAKLVLKSIDLNANVNVSVFETNIRVIGGLLSAHLMYNRIPGVQLPPGWPCSGPLLDLAERLAQKLMPAFNTETGMPYGTVNLRHGVHRYETPVTCTAGVGTYILEFGTLSRLTGNPHYERVALVALSQLYHHRSSIGLVGNHINVQTGVWTATEAGIGAGVDSYFEYLVKGAILLDKPALMKQFREYEASINGFNRHDDWFLWVTMLKGQVSLPVFQSLEAFWPGLLTLVGDVDSAMRIILTYNQVIKQYGFPPEFYNIPNLEAAIDHSARTSCGYATVHNVKDHTIEDRMESFFLAETTKYLYLLFDPDNFIHNDGETAKIVHTSAGKCVVQGGGYIFNTEAHPLDPLAIYCCSKERQKHMQQLQQFEDNIDLMDLMGLKNDIPPLLNETDLPGEIIALQEESNPKFEVEVAENVSEQTMNEMDFTKHKTNDENEETKNTKTSGGSVAEAAEPNKTILTEENFDELKLNLESFSQESKKFTDALVDALQSLLQDWNSVLKKSEKLQKSLTKSVPSCLDCCRIVDKDYGSPALNRFVSLIYSKNVESICAAGQKSNELNNYMNTWPKDLFSPNIGDDGYVELTTQHHALMTCPAAPFLTRFTALGQVTPYNDT